MKKVVKFTKEQLHSIVKYFYCLKEWGGESKDFYEEHKIVFKRFLRPARDLLELAKGDIELVKKKIRKIKEWAENRGLNWGLETVIKRWFEKEKEEELDFYKLKQKEFEERYGFKKNRNNP